MWQLQIIPTLTPQGHTLLVALIGFFGATFVVFGGVVLVAWGVVTYGIACMAWLVAIVVLVLRSRGMVVALTACRAVANHLS